MQIEGAIHLRSHSIPLIHQFTLIACDSTRVRTHAFSSWGVWWDNSSKMRAWETTAIYSTPIAKHSWFKHTDICVINLVAASWFMSWWWRHQGYLLGEGWQKGTHGASPGRRLGAPMWGSLIREIIWFLNAYRLKTLHCKLQHKTSMIWDWGIVVHA